MVLKRRRRPCLSDGGLMVPKRRRPPRLSGKGLDGLKEQGAPPPQQPGPR